MRRLAAFGLLGGLGLALAPAGAVDGALVLPAPTGTIPVIAAAFPDRPERLRTSSVPGPLRDTEQIAVSLDATGAPVRIEVTQRLELTGTGDYVIRERASALAATALDDTPAPVLQREAVVWQGFVPGSRLLAARISLDPVVEAPRLPLRVNLRGQAPGRIVVSLTNATARPERVATGDVAAADLVAPMDALLAAASAAGDRPPPMAGRGLPARLAARGLGTRDVISVAPLRITGRLRVPSVSGVRGTGPGTTPLLDGVSLSGVLAGSAEITLDVPAAGRLELDLAVVPALDDRVLHPPSGATWAQWAATQPDEPTRRAATGTLVDAALGAARADEYAPYLGHHGPGEVLTTFRYTLAEPARAVGVTTPLRPRPYAITLACVAALAVLANTYAIWRRL